MRPSKILTIALSLAALAGLALAGCGGGSSTASTAATTETTAALSKAELISQGDAICGEVNAAVGAAEIVTPEGEASKLTAKVAGLYVGMVESIKRLGAPEEAAGYPEFIAAAEALSKLEGEAKLAAEREDTAALEEASAKTGPALEEFKSAASEYGFEKCGEGPKAPTSSGANTGTGGGSTGEAEEGGVEAAPEEVEEAPVEEVAPEEVAPETGGAGSGAEEAAPESGGGSSGGSSGGVGPG